MRPLQDQCEPTPFEDVKQLFLHDMGYAIEDEFDEFNEQPIGVASLAQVHVGRIRKTGELAAVKVRFVSGVQRILLNLHSCNIPISLSFAISTWRWSRLLSVRGVGYLCVSCTDGGDEGWIKHWFPEFEFTWLGEEMRENLPKEMDFIHEKNNAVRATEDFKDVRTSLYIRETSLIAAFKNSCAE